MPSGRRCWRTWRSSVVEFYYTVSQVSGLLQVHEKTVRGWIRAGNMAGVNLGSNGKGCRWRISAGEVERFLTGTRRSAPVAARSVGELKRKEANA